MKRETEPIIEYLKKIHCKSLNSAEQAYAFLAKELGDDAEQVFDVMEARGQKQKGAMAQRDFYPWKKVMGK